MRAKLMMSIIVASFGLFWPLSAAADKPAVTATSNGQTDVAAVVRDLLAHASASFLDGSFKEASDYYRAARKHRPTREIICNLAVSARLAGNLIEAAEALSSCLAEPPPTPISNEEKQRITRFRADLDAVLGQVGTLAVHAPAGAEVLLDGSLLGPAPLAAEPFVMPGSHVVRVRRNGDEVSSSIVVEAGKRAVVTLNPIAAPKAQTALKTPAPKTPHIRSTPVLISALAATGLILGGGWATLGASRSVGDGAKTEFAAYRKETTAGCGVPNPDARCHSEISAWHSAATLSKIGIAGIITGGVVGGGTLIYVVETLPASSVPTASKVTGFTVGWRGRW